MSINGRKLFQLFKYTIYVLLAFNTYLFFSEEVLVAAVQFPDGTPLSGIIEAYAATIDTAAWVVLLLMFELETYVLEDHHFSPTVTWTLHGIRVLSYTFIIYAFYGYVAILGSVIADAQGLIEIRYLAWVDVINSAVWLMVVIVLEIDVWLQDHNRFAGVALLASNAIKTVLYSLLLLAAIYWGIKGSLVDFWDAFLWLVAFAFIELNVFEWRQELIEEHQVVDS